MLVDNISVGKVNANLILTDVLVYDSDANQYFISYYQLKKGLNFHEVLNNIKNTDIKNEFFEPKIYTAMISKNIIYLNILPKVLQNYKHPIESSTISPDQWFFWNDNTSDYLKLSSIIREKKFQQYSKHRAKKKFLPNQLFYHKENITKIYISTSTVTSNKKTIMLHRKFHVIPYKITSDTVSFVLLSETQLQNLYSLFKKKGKMTPFEYKAKLDVILRANNFRVYQMLVIRKDLPFPVRVLIIA